MKRHSGFAGGAESDISPAMVRRVFLTMALLATVAGCGNLASAPPRNGRVAVEVVSWKLVRQMAEANAGLSGQKVTILNPADRTVVASGTTNSSGFIDFDLPEGTYILLGASDEPQQVEVQSGQTTKLKLVVH